MSPRLEFDDYDGMEPHDIPRTIHPMLHPTVFLVSVSAISVGITCIFFAVRAGTRLAHDHLPPGPKPLLFIGNLLDMPRKNVWETFSKWTESYGDVVYLDVLGRPIILLNSVTATTDLLEKRYPIYSDRPHLPLAELVGHNWNFGFKPFGPEWQSLRRPFASQYNSTAAMRTFHDAQRASVSRLVIDALHDPQGMYRHIRARAAQLILGVTYGIPIKSFQDPLVQNAEAVMDVVSVALSPVMWIINPVSILNCALSWVGGAGILSRVQRWQSDLEWLRNVPFETVKTRLADGLAEPCFTTTLLRELDPSTDTAEQEATIRDTAAIAFGAGYETTVTAGEVFLLVMALNPGVQLDAHKELDRVVGQDRLPDYIDRDQLPFITAVAKEVLRWHPPAPTGVPHQLRTDDVYRGMHIPAGAVVISNIWQILHDPTMYPDPSKFNPDRFIRDGKLDCIHNDPSRYVFGFGRRYVNSFLNSPLATFASRSCPGRLFAEDALWLMVAQFLALYSISVPVGSPSPEIAFLPGAISHPAPFNHVIRPRSEAAAHLLANLIDQ
ncbi:cytochrome P450 [Mycena rebaudengoi]|nr:cytochrome P450 [Mycena rebaudengoi]